MYHLGVLMLFYNLACWEFLGLQSCVWAAPLLLRNGKVRCCESQAIVNWPQFLK